MIRVPCPGHWNGLKLDLFSFKERVEKEGDQTDEKPTS
jgi:hypothetical protein